MNIRLKPIGQQVMVVVGASSGVGLATARLAASRGARLVLAGRSEGTLRRIVDELGSCPDQAIGVVADVTSAQEVSGIAEAAVRAFGGFDTWVNDASVLAYGGCLDVSRADMHRIMDTNFWGMVHGARVACAQFRRRGAGALINLGSGVTDRAAPLQGMYAASKHATKGWIDALRAELADDAASIAVTLVTPGRAAPARAVAKAILYAAEHSTPEIVVGGPGKVRAIMSTLAPRLTDAVTSAFLQPATPGGRR